MSTIKKTYVKRSAPANPNVVCCRACLATDGRLYDMHEHKLADAFTRISGISIQQDTLPYHICVICAALLQRFAAFQERCGRSHLWLLAGLVQKDFSVDYVRSINRGANELVALMPSAVYSTDILPEDVEDNAPKKESNYFLDIDTSTRMDTKDNIDTRIVKNTTDNRDTSNDEKTDVEYLDIYGSNVEDDECSIKSDLNDYNSTGDLDDGSQVKVKGEEEIVNKNTTPPQTDPTEFEFIYNVKVVYLTMEQQLEEIEARKKSSKYLEATYRCEHCGRGFESEPVFRKHCKKYDPSTGKHACTVCGARFRSRGKAREHHARHRTTVTCNACGVVYRTRPQGHFYKSESTSFHKRRPLLRRKPKETQQQQARYHARMHDGQKYCCHHCGQMFRTVSSYLTHVRLRHPTAHVSCDMCGEGFIGQAGLRQHKVREHGVSSQGYPCAMCETVFVTSGALQQHAAAAAARGHGALAACRWCGDTLHTQHMLDRHTAERHPTCEQCCQTFLDAAAHLTHHKRKHLGEVASLYRFQAPYMKKKRAQRSRRSQPAPPGQPIMCELCGKMQRCRAILVEHMQRHAGAPTFACRHEGCSKKFYNNTELKAHEHRHVNQQPFQCELCRTTFTFKHNLERHMLVKHLGKGLQVPCEVCGRVFTARSSVALHRRTVHGGEPHPVRKRKHERNKPESRLNSLHIGKD